ncbi:kinase [Halobacteriales archaeon SW_7_68_16]|nr:MAG: kinase [Halobacteriales archaeon SW_7_68_16]
MGGATGTRTSHPLAVVVCGLPGVGKTTVSEAIADRLGADLLRTDVVRKDLFPDPDYTDEEERRTYAELLDRGRQRLDRGRNVVLDGTFYDPTYRRRALAIADDIDATVRLVKVECDEDAAKERIRARTDDESDADIRVYLMFRDLFEPIDIDHDVVDNSGTFAETDAQIDELL